MMRDFNDLQFFTAVVLNRGFSAASHALGVPKSRVSRRVALLDERLGVPLLDRTTRGLGLTQVGQQVFEHARAAGEMSNTAKPDGPQPLLTARIPGERCTSLMKFASRGEVLSLRHTRDSARGMSKSTTGKMTIVSGDRQRAVPMTHPTPKPVATRLRIVASFSPS